MKLRKPDFAGLFQELRHFNLKRATKRVVSGMGEGWYVPGDEASKDRARLLTYNYTANVIANLIGGSFWTGLLILMNASDSFIGSMSMISTAANMLQLFAPILLERFEHRKKLLLTLRLMLYIFNVVIIGLIPLFPGPQQTKLAMVAVSVAIVNVLNAVHAPGISIWYMQSLPNRVRNPFFSLITMTVGAVVALSNLLGSFLVDAFKAMDMEYVGLLILRGVALALVIVEIYQLSRVKEYPYEKSGDKLSVKDLLLKPIKNKLYMRTVLVVFLWNITANIPGSYYTVYLLKNVEVSYTYIMIVNMINVPIVLLLTPIWSRLQRKFGWFNTLAMGMSIYSLHYVGLALVSKGTLWLYPVTMIVAFFFAIGINLSFTGIPYVNMPKENQTAFIGFYSTAANLAALIGVTIGRYFVEFTETWKIDIFGFTMVNKQILVLITGVLIALAALGVFWIRRSLPGEDN